MVDASPPMSTAGRRARAAASKSKICRGNAGTGFPRQISTKVKTHLSRLALGFTALKSNVSQLLVRQFAQCNAAAPQHHPIG